MVKRVIIYGAGKRGIQLYKWLIAGKIENIVYAFCDKNYKNIDLPWGNITILPYESLKDGNFIFLVPMMNSETIQEMLALDNQEYYSRFEDFVKKYFYNNENVMAIISTAPFERNENNKLLEEYYNKCNYKVKNFDENREICYIFFSSNGIYFPNEIGIFIRTIAAEDRFEWENLVDNSNLQKYAAKCIFVRDLFKAWYVAGINSRICSLDKLIDFLKEEVKGYKVITVGSSAGGYMASLVGAKLNAHLVFNFSGQFSLYLDEEMNKNYCLNKYKESQERSKYFNICEHIKNTVPIIYFYPKYSIMDKEQAALVEGMNNVYSIPVNSYIHGETITNEEKAMILTKSFSEIKEMKKWRESL